MPITPKYTWTETNTEVIIVLDIPADQLSAKTVDVYATDVFVKVNCSPWLFMLDLVLPVNPDKCKSVVEQRKLKLILTKEEEGMWLALKHPGDKKYLKERRNKSIEEQDARAAEARKRRKEKKNKFKDSLQKTQWALKDDRRDAVQNLKTEEIKEAEKDVYNWKDEQEEKKRKEDEEEEAERKESIARNKQKAKEIWSNEEAEKQDASQKKQLPAPRSKKTQVIEFDWSERSSKTPAREDVDAERRMYLEKARKAKELADIGAGKALPPPKDAAQQPLTLKEKGDSFYRAGDLQGAVSAYSEALSLIQEWPTLDSTGLLLLACYSNRSACYLRLSKWDAYLPMVGKGGAVTDNGGLIHSRARLRLCVGDCARGLSIICDEVSPPPLVQVQKEIRRSKLLARRGNALWLVGHFKEAVADFSAAKYHLGSCKFRVHGEWTEQELGDQKTQKAALYEVDQLLARYQGLLERHDKGEHDTSKGLGDEALQAGDYDKACKLYTQSIQLNPVNVPAFSNRAACYLAMGQGQAAFCDSSCAIVLLDDAEDPDGDDEDVNLDDDEDEEVKRSPVLQLIRARALARRGASLAWLGKFTSARADLAGAVDLNPDDSAMKRDLESVDAQLMGQKFIRKAAQAYRKGNYEQAASVYTKAVEWHSNPENTGESVSALTLAVLLSNRSACHLSLSHYADAAKDASRAIAMVGQLKDPAAANTVVRSSLLRRGSARAWLGELPDGAEDYEEVLRMYDGEVAALVEKKLVRGVAANDGVEDEVIKRLGKERTRVEADLQRIQNHISDEKLIDEMD